MERPKKKQQARIYWRDQGRERRAYGDFRRLGGGQEALIVRGEKRATTDPEVAAVLFGERVKELEAAKRHKGIHGRELAPRLEDYAARHLELKEKAERVTVRHVGAARQTLKSAVEHLGAFTRLDEITVEDVTNWMNALAARPNRRKGTLSGATRRHYLNNLSNVYRRAMSEGKLTFNPAAALMEKPRPDRHEAKWLEPHEAALLLESARTCEPARPDMATPGFYAILATMLLTGLRKSETLGLAVGDVSFERNVVTVREHEWRRLKTEHAKRQIPLWPQLRAILRDHLFGREVAEGGLLFPNQEGQMVGDFDKTLDAVAARCGWAPGEIRSKQFRHCYASARAQTLDRGEPVSLYTVQREMGHGGRQITEAVYTHLGEIRQRSPVVEFFAEDHRKVLGERLTALEASTVKANVP